MTDERAHADDRLPNLAAAFGFSTALGVATLIVPLVALDAGYDPPTIGFLAAIASITQVVTRLGLPWVLGRFRDRSLMIVGCLGIAAMFALLLVSTTLPVFVTAQVLQGASRSLFWTSSQTHVVRGPGPAVRRLVDMNVAGNLGTLTGPAVAGMLAVIALPLALAAAIIAALVGAGLSSRLRPLAPFDRSRSAGAIALIGRPGVDVACWAGLASGAWWSMVGSFIPVLLVGAGFGSAGVGWLITASEGAGMVALLVQRGVSGRARIRRRIVVATLVTAGVLAVIAVIPGSPPGYIALLIAGGAASGTVTTLGPALASLAAQPEEQGDAFALQGTFRSVALFGAPAAVGALVTGIALGPALVVLSGAMVVPGMVIRLRRGGAAPAVGG